jgi:Domain of unknown function (DUF4410)
MSIMWKVRSGLYLIAIAGQVATAQNSVGNILTGEAKVEIIKRYSGSELLPKPEMVVIRDLAVPAEAITTDESLAAQLHRKRMLRRGSDEDSTPEILTQQVQASFAEALAGELKKVNVQSQRAYSGDGASTGSSLIIDGEFIAVNEGDKSKRIMIGFGRGASDIQAHVIVSALRKGQRTVVLEFNLKSDSGKKPGAAATMGVGSLAVGAVAGGVGDKKGTVQADASRMGTAVAKQIEGFMISQEWISPPQNGKAQ